MAGVPAPRSHEPEDGEGHDAGGRRGARDAKNCASGARRSIPVPLVELEPRAVREQIEQVELETSLAAVRNARVEVPPRDVVSARLDGDGSKGNVDTAHLVAEPRPPGALEAFLELFVVSAGADHGHGVHGGLLFAQALRELEAAFGPLGRLLSPHGTGAPHCEVGVGPGELRARWQPFEQGDCLSRTTLRFRRPSGAPEEVGETSQCVSFLQSAAECTTELECLLQDGNAFVVLIGEVAGLGGALE